MPVLVRGNFDSDVILLMVHGGVGGSSGPHIEDFSGMLEEKYMVAFWDQRHAGSSQGNFDKEDFTIDLMAEDMQMVIRMLKEKYGADKKVFSVGHSWGVILSTYYLITQDNLLHGAIQSNGSHSTIPEYSARLDYTQKFAQEMIEKGMTIPEEIKKEGETFSSLEQIVEWTKQNDPIETWKQLKILNALYPSVSRYVRSTYFQRVDAIGNVSYRELDFQSHYHPLIESINGLRTQQLVNNHIKEESIQEFYDFSPQMGAINLPICLIWGKYDPIIGLEVAEDYYQKIATQEEDKELVILERSGHTGLYRENIKFSNAVINFVEKHK